MTFEELLGDYIRNGKGHYILSGAGQHEDRGKMYDCTIEDYIKYWGYAYNNLLNLEVIKYDYLTYMDSYKRFEILLNHGDDNARACNPKIKIIPKRKLN